MGILLGASICTLDKTEPYDEENVTKVQKLYKLALKEMRDLKVMVDKTAKMVFDHS